MMAGYIASGLGFVFWSLVTQNLTLADSGQILALTYLVPFLVSFAALGRADTILRFLQGHGATWSFFWRVSKPAIVFALFVSLMATLVLSTEVKEVAPGAVGLWLWWLIVPTQVIAALLSAASISVGRPDFNIIAIASTGIVKISVLLIVEDYQISTSLVLVALLVSNISEVALFIMLLRKKLKRTSPPIQNMPIGRYSVSNWISSTVSLASTALLPFLILFLGGAERAAQVAIPLLFFGAMTLPTASLARSFLASASSNPNGARNDLRQTVFTAVIISVLLTATMFVAADQIVGFFGENFGEASARLIQGFSIVAMLSIPNYFIDAYLNFQKRTLVYGVLNVGGAVLNILAIYFSIAVDIDQLVIGMCMGQVLYTILAFLISRNRRNSNC